MPRRLLLVLAGLLLFAASAASGTWAVKRLGPGQVRRLAEQGFGALLDTRIALSAARLELARGPRISARGLAAWPGASGPALRIDRVSARIDPLALLFGRLRLRGVHVDGAHLSLVRGADGAWEPSPFPAALGSEPGPDAPGDVAVAVAGAIRSLLSRPLPGGSLEVRRASLRVVDRTRPASAAFLAGGIQARVVRQRLSAEQEVFARGWLRGASRRAASFELRARRERGGTFESTLAVGALPLADLVPFLPAGTDPLAGVSLSGIVVLQLGDGGMERLELDLVAQAATGEDSELAARLGSPRASVRAELAFHPGRVELTRARLRAGELRVEATGEAGRPLDARAPLQLELRSPRIDLTRAADAPAWLPAAIRGALEPLAVRALQGRLEDLALELRGVLADAPHWLSGERLPQPLSASLSLSNAVVELAGTRLEVAEGRVRLRDDTLVVEDLRARSGDELLPLLDLTLSGLHRLAGPDSGRRAAPPPVADLPGLRAAWSWLDEQIPDGGAAARVELVELAVDWLAHPALRWPLEGVRGALRPRDDGVELVLERAAWGGLGLRGHGRWRPDPKRLELALELVAPEAPRTGPRDPDHWLRGRFAVAPLPLGHWRIAAAGGEMDAWGTELRLGRVNATLREHGRLQGTIALDLSRPGEVPFAAEIALAEAQFSELAQVLLLGSDAASGEFEAEGSLSGRLRPGEPVLASAVGDLTVQGTGGELRGDLALVAAVQTANRSYSAEEARDPVRFDAISGELRLEQGRLRIAPFSTDGPEVRLFASGEIDVLAEPHRMEVVLALFLYRDLDRVLGQVPVLNSFLLGSDDNLVGAYFVLTGPWRAPRAERIPNRTFAGGPMGFVVKDVPTFMLWNVPVFVLRDVPGFVISGIKTIHAALLRPPGPRRAPATAQPKPEGS